MQVEKESKYQLIRLISTVLREAIYDYSYSGDMSVVNINGTPLIFEMNQLRALHNVREQLEKEV